MNGNGNGDVHDVEVYEDESELRSQAIALTDRTLTAIGGLETGDPAKAAEGRSRRRITPRSGAGPRR
jgi:hypothetical protein